MTRLLIAGVMLAAAGALAPVAWGADLLDRCRLEPVRGNCKALLEKFMFDQGRRKCVSFIYDGCGPVVPFDELEDCQALCEATPALRLGEVRRVRGMPLARVEIEYPKDWTDPPELVARVSGNVVAARRIGGGSSPNANMATLEVFLGTGPVTELGIEAQFGDRTDRAFTPLHWTAEPLLALLDHAGRNDAIVAPSELRFIAFKAGAPVVRHNGTEIVPERIAGAVGETALWRVSPPWAAGRNTVSVEATGTDGGLLSREYSFVNIAGNELKFRQKAMLAYGEPGTRSGPFYRLEVAGEAVALGAEVTVEVTAVDDEGWPVSVQKLAREIVGAVPGEATLRIFEKPHFTASTELKQEIRLLVVQ